MKLQTLLLSTLLSFPLFAQTFMTDAELREAIEYQNSQLSLEITRSRAPLPSRVDNSKSKYFPPVFSQRGGSCVAASRVGYIATYLNNYLYDEDASDPDHQLSHHAIYNMFNGGSSSNGASPGYVMFSLSEMGCLTNKDWQEHGANDFTTWATGYDVYHKALKYKNYLPERKVLLKSHDDIQLAKQWLYDMGKRVDVGGLICVSGKYLGNEYAKITSGPEAGKEYIKVVGQEGGHSFTIVGYDDSIGFDFNGDGQFTTDVDITGDGEVTLADCEYGAFIFCNSWGTNHCNDGFVYAPYRHLGVPNNEGGMGFNENGNIVPFGFTAILAPEKKPEILGVLDITLTLENRKNLLNHLGISSHKNATPEVQSYLLSFAHRGGANPLGGESNGHTLEIALDISDWMRRDNSADSSNLFWGVKAGKYSGQIHSVKLHDYRGESEVVTSFTHPAVFDSTIAWTTIPLLPTPKSEKLYAKDSLVQSKAGQEVAITLQPTGGVPPYSYAIDSEYYHMKSIDPTLPEIDYDTMPMEKHYATHIPMAPTSIMGDSCDTIYMMPNGFLFWDSGLYRLSYPQSALRLREKQGISAGVYPGRIESDPQQVAYKCSGSELFIHIKTNAVDRPRVLDTPCEMAYRFGADGTIEVYYLQFPTDVVTDQEVVMGISNGFDKAQQFPIHSYEEFLDSLGDDGKYALAYLPPKLPEVVSITDQGVLTMSSSQQDLYRIPVGITDSKGATFMASVEFSTKEISVITSGSIMKATTLSVNKNALTIEGLTESATLSLYRANGQRVFEEKLRAATMQRVMLPNIARGLYLAELKGKDISLTKKFLR